MANNTDKDLGLDEIVKPIIIKEASIKDSFCNYTYEVNTGVGLGDKHKVNGENQVVDDMIAAFNKFNVHLACIDDIFKHSKTEITDIDTMHNHELTYLYHVTGFKMKGSVESESIILTGNKYVTAGSRIEFETPRIALDNLSSYKWYNELKAAADNARYEVEEYMNGKYIIAEVEETKPKMKQTKMTFMAPEAAEGKEPKESKEDKKAKKDAAKSVFDNSKV